MLKKLQRHPLYFSFVMIFLCGAFMLNLLFSKTDSFVLLNQFHTTWLDNFFTFYTFFGDGLVSIALIALFFLLRKQKKAATMLLAFISSALVAQILKNIYNEPRPRLYFEQTLFHYTHFIQGVTLYNSNSFPSGHTTSAFAMATVLVLLFRKKKIAIPCFLGAALVGFSRIYLAQHFLIDVFIGACIGVSCGMMSYYLVRQQNILKVFKRSRKKRKRLAPETMHPQWI